MTTTEIIQRAFEELDKRNPQQTDGKWLEQLTVDVAPHIKEWDISEAALWSDWAKTQSRFQNITKQDIGIDVVAMRRSDGKHIAIQCKARKLDEQGQGVNIKTDEINKFLASTTHEFWDELWLVTNGSNRVPANAQNRADLRSKPLKVINIYEDLCQARDAMPTQDDNLPPPHSDADIPPQTRTSMQDEAVAESVRILQEHERTNSGGLPKGQARGKIILPCGTGKTRISLRIVEKLTKPGELAIVLCPSIALVAQIRREYLQHSSGRIRPLAVCSDKTAGYDPNREDSINTSENPTVDNSNISETELKGRVTTDSREIAKWIKDGKNEDAINVIFGTYQSGRKVADALKSSKVTAKVLIADEAHRTAGLRRRKSRTAKAREKAHEEEKQIRDFTLCHNNKEFPVTYRVYQTATPKVFELKENKNDNWIVRDMDDVSTFGVELYRKSYPEAVKNRWLSDYRIIALGVNDPEAYKQANQLASETELSKKKAPSSAQYLKGLVFALAMGGAAQGSKKDNIPINSCIAFLNTVAKSEEMSRKLQTEPVREWIQEWLQDNADGSQAKKYRLEHLDATSNVVERDQAKQQLANATSDSPYGILNVGIFGEGTDSPSLSAVAFLEARKSPIDVIQAVGRAMRTAPNKELGYIICPILIPPDADPESWLSTSDMEEGWQELGQILLALRAHDQRIEDELSDLLKVYIPSEPEKIRTIVAYVSKGDKEKDRIQYREYEGPPGAVEEAVEKMLQGKSKSNKAFHRIGDTQAEYKAEEPTQIISGKKNSDGEIELRIDTVARKKPAAGEARGAVDYDKSKKKAKKMINEGAGTRRPRPSERKERRTREEMDQMYGKQLLLLSGLGEHGDAIKMNLLRKSGLRTDRVARDLNLLENAVNEASRYLESDNLTKELNRHFGLDNLKDISEQADGCTIVALLMMNAAMLHQRISDGGWMPNISPLSEIKNSTKVIHNIKQEWERIMRIDFRPIFQPAVDAIYAIEKTGTISGLENALSHISAEAERIAETYADMGADHAGPLFNKVMGNQASDGAFFTRPPAASLAARLTLDACGEQNWSDPEVWQQHKTADLACGSGTLLAAMMTDMKRRAKARGANERRIAELQKIAVQDTIKGMDINPVSLQLAAAQLTAGNREVRYRRMGLHLMPYGPDPFNSDKISAGTLELLAQKVIADRDDELNFPDDTIDSQEIWEDNVELEDAVDAAKDAHIIIMNPPFTNRFKMGEKFPVTIQEALRNRTDQMKQKLIQADPDMMEFTNANSIGPLFVGLADHCVKQTNGILTMINPAVALTVPSGQCERLELARRFHIHTVLTSHQPRNINMSSDTSISESIIVMQRHSGSKPPTRFINLDRMPIDEDEVADFHQCLLRCQQGLIANGWGEVSHWPAERIQTGDWTPAIWRSPELAQAAADYCYDDQNLLSIKEQLDLLAQDAGRVLRGSFVSVKPNTPGSLPILKSKSADAQTFILGVPDEHWIPKKRNKKTLDLNESNYPEVEKILQKAGYLLITAGQRVGTGRLTAVAGDEKYVGNSWIPVTGLSSKEAKAAAVFINSTVGRLQLMRVPGRTLDFPSYSVAEVNNLRIPNIKDKRICKLLANCWERTKDMVVPQFRDGECEVRRRWDEAVAKAMSWDAKKLKKLRLLLYQEPHVCGLGYNQYADEPE